MPTQLPPDDLPPNPGLVPSDDEAAMLADAGPASLENPITIGAMFLNALSEPGGPNLDILTQVVTPESLTAWGDFTGAAELLAGCGMTTRANPSDTDPHVVYVKYVTDDGQSYRVGSDMLMTARAIGTLVWRPELGSWRLHALGEYLAPELVPR